MATRTILSERVPEKTTPTIRATLLDEAGAAITSLTSCLGTLYDVRTSGVINNRTDVNMLSFVAAGVLSWTMTALDNVVIRDKKDYEELHRLQLVWTYGGKTGAHEIDFYVSNLWKTL